MAMITLPNNCRVGKFSVYPKNWNTQKAKTNKACVLLIGSMMTIISPNAINNTLNIVTITPLTYTNKKLSTRVAIVHNKKSDDVCIEQIRTISKERIVSIDKQPIKEKYRESIILTIFEYFK